MMRRNSMTHQVKLDHLTLQSTLADLPSHDFLVGPRVLGSVVAARFEAEPELPGVVIRAGERLVGAFSRRQFLEKVGKLYGIEVYLNRPVAIMVKNIGPRHIALQSTQTIQSAAEMVLRSPANFFEDALIVVFPDGHVALIDVRVLILAQSHLLGLVTEIEQQRRQLAESMQRIGRELSGSLELGQVTKRILKELNKVLSYERGLVMLADGEHLKTIAKRGFPKDIKKHDLLIPIRDDEDDVFRRIVESREPIWLDDVTGDESWTQRDDLPVNYSWLGVPLKHQGRVMGMLSLTREERAGFSEDDVRLVQAFGSQAAVALENARLYDEITHLNNHLEEMVSQRTLELNKAYEILERLDKNKSDFISVAAHELRTPITVMSGYAQILETLPVIQGDVNNKMMVGGINTGIKRMHRIINSMLDIARLDSDTMKIHAEPLLLPLLLGKVGMELTKGMAGERRVALDFSAVDDSLSAVLADPDLMQKLFHGLLVNAIKYTPDGGEVRVAARETAVDDEPFVEVCIADTGIGIPPESLELIFEKFYQTGEVALHSSGFMKFKGGGPGLGLAIAKGIVAAHGGKIWAESAGYDEERLPGSAFYVRLPIS